jgi:hypothetical protein
MGLPKNGIAGLKDALKERNFSAVWGWGWGCDFLLFAFAFLLFCSHSRFWRRGAGVGFGLLVFALASAIR